MPELFRLKELAKQASQNAYARYSNFKVGAVLVTPEGLVYQGCNVENASYGLTCCAERTAIFAMISAGQRKIDTLVIYTATPKATAPCGACRQVINEFGPDARVISVCDTDDHLDMPASALLPHSFGPHSL
ncbi:cytidine deaminase [Comamonas thiooxydans]|uniref:cytidine deaminase n=1 Tax=Comamonas thiooxydans TaxID=363952 RepID=UPI000B40A58B|nr:cytidine deaminase [Comamonas thiooxydans]